MEVDKSHPEAGFVELEPLAIAAVDLIWVIVGLLCLMILGGFWVIATILDDLFGSFSIFGFHPFGFAKGLLSGVMKKEAGFLDSKVNAFGQFLWSNIMIVWRFFYVAVAVLVGLWEQYVLGQNFQNGQTGAEASRAQAAEKALAQQEAADVAGLRLAIGESVGLLTQQQIDDFGALQTQINQLQTEITNLGTQSTAAIEAELHNDVATIDGQLAGLSTQLANGLAQEATNLTQQLAQQRTVLEQEIANSTSTAEQFATGAAAGAEAGAIAQTLAQLQPQIDKIVTDTTECLDPLCDTVTPNAKQLGNLGKLLKDLEGLFAAGALMALLVAAVEDPKGTATVVTDTMGWVAPLSLDLVDVVGEAAGVQL